MLRSVVLILLPLLSIAGAYGTWVLGAQNGTFQILTDILSQRHAQFPGTEATLVRHYTMISAIDHQLQILVAFFAPVVGSGNNSLVLFGIMGAGQFGATWTLLMMESQRLGNKGKLQSIGTVGLLIQNISFTVTVPLYLTIHLLTSPVAKRGSQVSNAFLISEIDLKLLPFSIILGYILPTVLMALPSPGILSPELHQKFIALWQPFPLWTVIIHLSISYLFGNTSPNIDNTGSPASLRARYINAARPLYNFVLNICMITHLPVLAITLLPPRVFSGLSPRLASVAHSTFSDVFIPNIPSFGFKASNLSAGVHTFLHWDLYIGSIAVLSWAIVLCRTPKIEAVVREASVSWAVIAWKIATRGLVSGPAGVVAALLLERDMIISEKIKV